MVYKISTHGITYNLSNIVLWFKKDIVFETKKIYLYSPLVKRQLVGLVSVTSNSIYNTFNVFCNIVLGTVTAFRSKDLGYSSASSFKLR